MAHADEARVRRLAVLTTTRADYGLWRPLLDELEKDPAFDPLLVVSGTHLEERHGGTLAEIEADGRTPWCRIPLALEADTPAVAARAIARLTRATSEIFADPGRRPDALFLLGDRFELMGAASAALVHRVPILHVHGGEITLGAIDDAVRHAVSKMAALHFASSEEHARRLRRMGEPASRVHMVGALGVDALRRLAPLSERELCRRLGLAVERLPDPLLLVACHPLTRDPARGIAGVEALLRVLERFDHAFCVFTAPNADPGGADIRRRIEEFVARHHARSVFVESLGHRAWASLMRHAAALVGNSSSGILEAPAVPTASIDIGPRQQGRPKAESVLSCREDAEEIMAALARALDPAWRAGLARVRHPFGDGRTAERIVAVLRGLDWRMLAAAKPFADPAPDADGVTSGKEIAQCPVS